MRERCESSLARLAWKGPSGLQEPGQAMYRTFSTSSTVLLLMTTHVLWDASTNPLVPTGAVMRVHW